MKQPRDNPLLGRRAIWLRNRSDTAEVTTEKILDTMQEFGFDCLAEKCMDGATWQGVVDSSTPILSIADVLAVKAACEARGVSFIPVVVPRGAAPRAEAQAHGELFAACGAGVTDIEPYGGLYDLGPLAQIPDYCQALRAAAPDAYLVNQPDPRPYGLQGAHVAETAGYYDAICGQHYVGWVEVGWTAVQPEVDRFGALTALGRDMYVTLWGVGDTNMPGAFWQMVQPYCWGYTCFALGSMDSTHLQALGAGLPAPLQPAPPPPAGPSDTERLAMYDGVARGQYAQLRDLAAKYAGAK